MMNLGQTAFQLVFLKIGLKPLKDGSGQFIDLVQMSV